MFPSRFQRRILFQRKENILKDLHVALVPVLGFVLGFACVKRIQEALFFLPYV